MSNLNVLNYSAEKLDPAIGLYSYCRIGKCAGCQVVVKKFKVIKDVVVNRIVMGFTVT